MAHPAAPLRVARRFNPQPPLPAPGDVWNNISQRLARLTPEVINNPTAAKYLADNKMPHRARDNEHSIPNPHAAAAAVRYIATREALRELMKLHPHTITSCYGSARDADMWATVRANLPDAPELLVHAPRVIPEDIKITAPSYGQVIDGIFHDDPDTVTDCFLFVDVYALEDRPLTPENLSRFLGGRPAVFVLTRFAGMMGSDHTGCWIRCPDGQIEGVPDDLHPEFIREDPVDWLHVPGAHSGLAWTVLKPILNKDVIYVTPTPVDRPRFTNAPLRVLQVDVPSASCYWLATTLPFRLYRWLYPYMPKQKVLVPADFYGDLTSWLAGRTRVAWNFRSLYDEARTRFRDAYKRQFAIWPEHTNTIFEHTIQSVWTTVLPDLCCAADATSSVSGFAGYLNEFYHNVDVSQHSWTASFWAFVTAAVPLTIAAWRNRDTLAALARFVRSLRITNANLFNTCWSPFVEELIKTYPPFGLILAISEAVITQSPFVAIFHCLTMYLPFWVRVPLHYAFNFLLSLVQRLGWAAPTAWSRFKASVYSGTWIDRRMPEPIVKASIFPQSECYVPLQDDVNAPDKPACPDLVVTGIPNDRYVVANRNYVAFLPTDVPLYACAKTPHMLYKAVQLRILARPPLAPSAQRENWRQVEKFCTLPPHPVIQYDAVYPAWLANFPPSKQKQMVAVKSQIDRDGLDFQHLTTKLFVKMDETLPRTTLSYKPRVIANVDPRIQVAVGPYIREAQTRLHMAWSVDCDPQYRHDDNLYHVCFGSGLTDVQLSTWMRRTQAHPDVWFIMVAGDDSIVAHDGTYVCADASSFDQSQSFGPLAFEWVLLSRLGLPEAAIDVLHRMATAPYSVDRDLDFGRSIHIDRQKRPMRDTGGPDTTIGNSIVMAAAWLFVLMMNGDYVQLFLFLGFAMKINRCTIDTANFLKGSWPTIDGERCWLPLPSRFLKFGKSLTDPRVIFRTKDLLRACQMFCHNLASSYQTASAVPLIGTFVTKYLMTHSVQQMSNDKDMHLYSVVLVQRLAPRDRNELLRYYSAYYEVPEGWFIECEEMIRTAPLFSFLQHPLFRRLAEHDYE